VHKTTKSCKNIHVKLHALTILKFQDDCGYAGRVYSLIQLTVKKNLAVVQVCMECWLSGSDYQELIQALDCIPDHQLCCWKSGCDWGW